MNPSDPYHDAGHRLRIHDKRVRLHPDEQGPPFNREEIPQRVMEAAAAVRSYMTQRGLKSLCGLRKE